MIRRLLPNAQPDRSAMHGIRWWCRPEVRLRRRLTCGWAA